MRRFGVVAPALGSEWEVEWGGGTWCGGTWCGSFTELYSVQILPWSDTVLSVWEISHVYINATESWVRHGGEGRKRRNAFTGSTLLLLVTRFPGALLGSSVGAALGYGSAAAFAGFSGEIGLQGAFHGWLHVWVIMLLAAQLAADGMRSQRALLMGLTEGVGAQLTESIRWFATHVTVVPGAIPTTCSSQQHKQWTQITPLKDLGLKQIVSW